MGSVAEALTCDVCGQIADKRASGNDLVYGLNAFWPEEPQDGSRDAAWITDFWVHRRCLAHARSDP